MALSREQVAFFKEEGYVVLENFIDPEQVAAWREQFWAHVGADPEEPAGWPDSYVIKGFDVDPAFRELPKTRAVVEQLGGGCFVRGNGSMMVRWPSGEDTWKWPKWGHVDGYGPGGWGGGFMLGATAYLDDVEEGGGALTFWPRSHLSTHGFFRQFPEQVDGSFREREDWKEQQWALFSDRSPKGPVQFVAKAGAVIFWHAFLCHGGSDNVRTHPRLAFFARWAHEKCEAISYEVPENLYKYWAI